MHTQAYHTFFRTSPLQIHDAIIKSIYPILNMILTLNIRPKTFWSLLIQPSRVCSLLSYRILKNMTIKEGSYKRVNPNITKTSL